MQNPQPDHEDERSDLPSVLVVDDSLTVCEMLHLRLSEWGYMVKGFAQSGREALEKIELLRPQLVTLDIVMPELDGIETLAKIRELHPETVVVMLTSVNEVEPARRCIALGARGYIVKPFQWDYVQQTLTRAWEHS